MSDIKEITVLAFDFGTKKIGVAVGETSTFSSKPLTIISNNQNLDYEIKKLISEWRPGKILVGLPLNMDGTEQKISEKAREFANKLKNDFDIDIELIDERLSTRAAYWHAEEHNPKLIKNRANVDHIAAELIIKSWFDSGFPPARE